VPCDDHFLRSDLRCVLCLVCPVYVYVYVYVNVNVCIVTVTVAVEGEKEREREREPNSRQNAVRSRQQGWTPGRLPLALMTSHCVLMVKVTIHPKERDMCEPPSSLTLSLSLSLLTPHVMSHHIAWRRVVSRPLVLTLIHDRRSKPPRLTASAKRSGR
jgi:hypothetical protein